MTHREKVDLLTSELTAKGVKQGLIAPPIYRWLWALGFETPPPLFGQSVEVVCLMGVLAAVAMGSIYWLTGLPDFFWRATLFGGSIAVTMGSFFYVYFRWKAKRLGLPAWEEYGRAADAPGSIKKERSDP